MPERNWPRHAVRVGLFEFRRSVRAIRRDTARAFLMAAGLVFPSLMLVGFVYLFAGVIRDAGSVALPPVARGSVALLWLFGVFIATQRVVSARPRADAEALMLTTVSARTVVGGLLVAETLRVLAYLGLPVLVLTGAAVYLFATPASALLIPLAGVLLGATAILVGMALGYAVALLIARSPFVARHRTVLGAVAALLAMGGYLLVSLPQAGVGQEALAILPVGWFVDLAVLGTPVRGSTTRAAVAVLGSLLLVLVGIVVVEREATRLWFADPVTGEEGRQPVASTVSGAVGRTALADAIAPAGIPRGLGVSLPVRRVAQWSLLRTRRDPRRLNFLLLPVVMVGSALVSSSAQLDSPLSLIAPAAAVVLPWAAGAIFAMNPFGDEGPVLPVTLTSTAGVSYVRGLMLPGLLFGLPLVVLVTAGAALVGPSDPTAAAGLVVVGVLTTLVAVTTAPAVGMWFPRFSAISIGQSRDVVPPRLVTTVVHFLGVTAPATLLVLLLSEPRLARSVVAGLVGFLPAALLGLAAGAGGPLGALAAWFHGVGSTVQATGVASFQQVGTGVLAVGAVAVALASYRLAVRRFDRYSPPT